MASVGVTAPTESIKPPTIGGNYDLDDAVVAGALIHGEGTGPPTNCDNLVALPIPNTQVIAAHNYGMSLWGRTAKIITQLPDGEKETYFLKVKCGKMIFFTPPRALLPISRVKSLSNHFS